MRRLLLLLAFTACATSRPMTPAEVQLASRIVHASTHNPCTPDEPVKADCLDDQGIVWSACAWNSCGMGSECRERHQRKVVENSCGGPDWPPCILGN